MFTVNMQGSLLAACVLHCETIVGAVEQNGGIHGMRARRLLRLYQSR